MGFGCVGVLLLGCRPPLVARFAPLALPVVLVVVWLLPGPVSERIGGDRWDLTPLRFVDLPALLVGMGAVDHVAVALGVALIAATAVAVGFRLTRRPERLAPLALLLVAYTFFPAMFRGIVLLHTRLPCFLLPLWLLALEPPAPHAHATLRGRLAIFAITAAWLAIFCTRLIQFNREAAEFHQLEARLPAGLAMRPLVFDRNTRVFPGVPAYLHYSAYYCVDKGGTQGYSFAM